MYIYIYIHIEMFLINIRTACYLDAFRSHALSQVTGFHGTQLLLRGGGCNRNPVSQCNREEIESSHEIHSYSTWSCDMTADR